MPALEDLRPNLQIAEAHLPEEIQLPAHYFVFHPYASQKNKEWMYWEELFKKLQARDINVVVIGRSETSLDIAGTTDLTNKTNLSQTQSIVAKAACLITTDSGPLHIAVGLNRPTIAIFGPTTRELGFYPSFANVVVVENTELSCRPCHVHGGQTCPKTHFKCMTDISEDHVLMAVDSLSPQLSP